MTVGFLSIQLTGDANATLERIGTLAKTHGVQLQFDGQSGSFSHMGVSGTFTIEADVVEIEFTKPALIPDSLVEEKIMKIFG
jgi:hypothetical protein